MRKAIGKDQSDWSNIQVIKINSGDGKKENWYDGTDNTFVPTVFGIYSLFCLYAYKQASNQPVSQCIWLHLIYKIFLHAYQIFFEKNTLSWNPK